MAQGHALFTSRLANCQYLLLCVAVKVAIGQTKSFLQCDLLPRLLQNVVAPTTWETVGAPKPNLIQKISDFGDFYISVPLLTLGSVQSQLWENFGEPPYQSLHSEYFCLYSRKDFCKNRH